MTDTGENERRIETSVELDAPVDAVWAALADARELSNWFPTFAEVKPGVGGHIRCAWNENQDWTSRIGVWEPNRHMQVVWCEATPPEQAEQAKKDGHFFPVPLAVDYHLENHGGKTILRLVQSGFSNDAAWDTQYDGTVRGWAYQLRGLKHYLENHRGTKRVVVEAKCRNDTSIDAAWERLMSPQALLAEGDLAGRGVGDRYTVTTATGDRLEGLIHFCNPPKDLSATVENLNNGFLRVAIDEACMTQPAPQVSLFLSTYGLPTAETDALRKRWQGMLDEVFTPVAS